MKYLTILFTCSLLSYYCADTPKEGNAATEKELAALSIPPEDSMECITGLLQCRDSIAVLIQTGKDSVRQYQLFDQTGTLIARHNEVCGTTNHVAKMTHAVVCGVNISTNKKSKIQRMNVFRIDTLVEKSSENAGFPFEFWCEGTDPKWHVEVTNYIGGIYYENAGDPCSWFCAWYPPKVNGNKWTYDIPAAPGTYEGFSLVIQKQKYTDANSKKEYDYACEIKVKGKTMKGGAIRGKADVLGPVELRQN